MATNLATAHHRPLLAIMGLTALLGVTLVLAVDAQDKDKVKQAEDTAPYRLRNIVRLGYTRPANVDDPTKGDKVVPIGFTDYQGKIVAGTVYFAVLQRNDRDRDRDRERDLAGTVDTWGTGLRAFDSRFIPGRNFDGGVSPRLDTRAKYIYLFQVVNDPGLDPRDIQLAAFDKIRAQDISSFALKLLVDPRYLTSWGYFHDTAFTALVPDRNLLNNVKLAADGAEQRIRLAVSSNPSILAELPNQAHRYRSPAYVLGKLARSFDIGPGLQNLAKSYDHEYLTKNRHIVGAAFADHELKLDERLKEPNFVQLMYFSGEERLALGEGVVAERDGATGVFRADWRNGQAIKLGQHSVLFGFTSDLAPVDEPVVLADAEESQRGRQMLRELLGDNRSVDQPAAQANDLAPSSARRASEGRSPLLAHPANDEEFISFGAPAGPLRGVLLGQPPAGNVAPGTAPTPASGGAAAGGGAVPGGGVGLGGGGGLGGGFPGGALGRARSAALGGGGGFGGGQSTATQGQQAVQTQQTGATVNVAATLRNQQAQQQQQGQLQGQLQGQQNGGHHQHNVVPAPASLLLGLLGLPALWLLRRQRSPRSAG